MSDNETETWRAVPGFEGEYEVSDLGRVRSLDRVIENPLPTGVVRRQRMRGQLLKPGVNARSGYRYVNLHSKSHHVHRLVMAAFVGPLPAGHHTRHLNGDPSDNRRANLAYGTPSENGQDMVRHGRGHVAKTHCKRGHPLSGDNLYRYKDGRRECVACMRLRYRASRGQVVSG